MARRRINYRRVRLLAFGAIAATLLAALAMIGVQQWRLARSTTYTDGHVIRQPLNSAKVAEVLWRPPRPIDAINSAEDEYEPRFSADGLTMYFVRGRPGGNAELHVSKRTLIDGRDRWSAPEPLTALNSTSDELSPQPSPDGRTLVFASNRPNGLGGFDLWRSTLDESGRWSAPENLGPAVNTAHDEYSPAFSPDGTLFVFASNRPLPGQASTAPGQIGWPATVRHVGGPRSHDLYVAMCEDGGIQRARLLVEVNSPYNDGTPAFSPAGDFLYFASDRNSMGGVFDLFRSRILRGKFLDPEDLGPSINSPYNELDPALTIAGFGLHFSSDRPLDGADSATSDYNVFETRRAEVFREVDRAAAAIDWAGVWRMLAPSLLWLLLLLLALLLLLTMLRGMQSRKLSLLVKCLMASTVVHLILMMMFSAWQVSVGLADVLRRGDAIKVALGPGAESGQLLAQVRGGLTDLEPSASITPSGRMATEESPILEPPALVSVSEWRRTELKTPESSAQRDRLNDAEPASTEFTPPSTAVRPPQALEPLDVALPAIERAAVGAETTITIHSPNAASTSQAVAQVRSTVLPGDSVAINISPPALANVPSAKVPSVTEGVHRDAPPPAQSHSAPLVTNVSVPARKAEVNDLSQVRLPAVESPDAPTSEAMATVNSPAISPVRSGSSGASSADVQADPQRVDIDADPTAVEVGGSLAISEMQVSGASSPQSNVAMPSIAAAAVPREASDVAIQLPSGPEPAPRDERLVEDVLPAGMGTSSPRRIDLPPTGDTDSAIVVNQAPATARLSIPGQPNRDVRDAAPAVEPAADQELHASARAPRSVQTASNIALPQSEVEQAAPRTASEPALRIGSRFSPEHRAIEQLAVAPASTVPVEISPAASSSEIATSFAPSRTIETNDAVVAALASSATDLPKPRLPMQRAPELDVAIPGEIAPPTDQYELRSPERREEIVKKMGGSDDTERAVSAALAWLARHQQPDGRWSAMGFDDRCNGCGGKARFETDIATTGLALMCFLGADHTHLKDGPYQERVRQALEWLSRQQRENGDLRGTETMYSHGIAAIALSEAYGMTGDADLRARVQAAVDFIANSRNREQGGWRYEPGQFGDTSVLGWQIMAMVSAKRAGLAVADDALNAGILWLEQVSQPPVHGLYAYQPGQRPSASMTAEGMFVLQLLGGRRDEARMRQSAEFIGENLPRWNDEPNTYYWYYATMAMFQHQGAVWDQWNDAIKRTLLGNQRTSGQAAGSWDPLDNWSRIGGRVYQTAICTLSLEVYYRYLPLYARIEE